MILIKRLRCHFPPLLKKKLPRLVKVVEISERESKRLNRKYRRINKPADVLSFRYGDDYGEILICPPVIRREAEKQGNDRRYRTARMILHGLIHLAGTHHEESERAAKKAAEIERKILSAAFSRRPKTFGF